MPVMTLTVKTYSPDPATTQTKVRLTGIGSLTGVDAVDVMGGAAVVGGTISATVASVVTTATSYSQLVNRLNGPNSVQVTITYLVDGAKKKVTGFSSAELISSTSGLSP